MNTRHWTKTITAAAVIALAFSASTASAGHVYKKGKPSHAMYDHARVISARPIIRYVTVTTPVKECWEETEYYTVNNRRPGVAGKTLFGAIVGGVIGHQIGGGRGNDVATIAGTLIGAGIANDAARGQDRYSRTEYSRPVTRCETRYQSRQEKRIDGYRVVYAYHGQKYATTTPIDPGKRMRIRVDVRPAI